MTTATGMTRPKKPGGPVRRGIVACVWGALWDGLGKAGSLPVSFSPLMQPLFGHSMTDRIAYLPYCARSEQGRQGFHLANCAATGARR